MRLLSVVDESYTICGLLYVELAIYKVLVSILALNSSCVDRNHP